MEALAQGAFCTAFALAMLYNLIYFVVVLWHFDEKSSIADTLLGLNKWGRLFRYLDTLDDAARRRWYNWYLRRGIFVVIAAFALGMILFFIAG